MFSPSRVVGALVVAVALAVGCKAADSKPRQSRGSSVAAAPAATSAPPAAVATSTHPVPSDSISERADRGRIQGDAQAPLWIIEASDFQCPFCKTWHDSSYATLLNEYVKTGKARLAYLNFPLNQHQNALPAAEAAMCASVQDKFWPMHDALFDSQHQWETRSNAIPSFDSIAARLAVSMPAWRECVAKHLTRPLIEADYARSQSAGVKSTPTFFVGDQKLDGIQPYSFFRQIVEAQLAKRGAQR